MSNCAMSNETDLDWLARNVHVWREGKREVLVCWPRNVDTLIWSYVLSDSGWITKHQWLARRAELQNKPIATLLTSWANWIAQDQGGQWWLFESKPGIFRPGASPDGEWSTHSCGGRFTSLIECRGEVLGDWRDTLEKRPKQAEFEPFVSVEDANPKFPRDVDYVGKINAATAKQPAPKGSGNPILGMVLADLTNRALEGKEKYGEPLLAHNGRNPLWDAYQEALDLAMYLRQAIEELG